MRAWLSVSLVSAFAAVLSSAALAANVTDVQGQVQLSSSGGPFKTITGPMTCNAGDVVRVVKDGSAQVVNPNGVVETASPGKPVICKAGPGPATAPSPAATAGAAGSAASTSTAMVVGGAIVIGAGAAGVVALTKKKSSASP
jgi:hypothetical protein